jgi:hypothetical protein
VTFCAENEQVVILCNLNIFIVVEPRQCALKPCGMFGSCFDIEDTEDDKGDYICLCEDGSVGKSCNETGMYKYLLL